MDAVKKLPGLPASGLVRDLRQAASLNSPEGHRLVSLLDQYAKADTRTRQLELLDSLLAAWGATSGVKDMHSRVAERGAVFKTNMSAADAAMLTILEQFNGRSFHRLPWENTLGQSGADGLFITTDDAGQTVVNMIMFGGQKVFLERAYEALRNSVYDGLLLQTRLKPYVEGLKVSITETGVTADTANIDQAFAARFGMAPAEAVRDLLDLQRITGRNMTALGWNGHGLLEGWLIRAKNDASLSAAFVPALADFGYADLRLNGAGTGDNDVVLGRVIFLVTTVMICCWAARKTIRCTVAREMIFWLEAVGAIPIFLIWMMVRMRFSSIRAVQVRTP